MQKIKRTWQVFALTFGVSIAMAGTAAGPGAVGKWSGTIEVHDGGSGTDVSTPVQVMIDEPQAGILSGKIGREGDDTVPIRNGKVEGEHVYFEASSGETVGAMRFSLTLSGDKMTGEMNGSVDTADIVGTVKFSRLKN